MKYRSTRDNNKKLYDSAQVIKQGLADDGGLFIPDEIPSIDTAFINKLCSLTYPERAASVLSLFLTDYTYDELLTDCKKAYSDQSFPGGAAPIVSLDSQTKVLELWHGPTAAFKDMALQIMPRLLSASLGKTGETRNALILVATSGDTGKASLEGYRDVDRVKIMVFYPVDGVSRVQKLQMATQTGNNVNVCAIRGNFDDAQTGVKKIFSDSDAASILDSEGYFLSSANSINWGRLAPQIVYYISSYCDLVSSGDINMGDTINVCVPTGNFGNIFAAYIAKLMGLPINRLICASNSNNVLTDFLSTGRYDRNRPFHITMSPSMDILISSNLERLLSFTVGTDETVKYMKSLAETGAYQISDTAMNKIQSTFTGIYADENTTAETIKSVYKKYGYLADTHTAVALACADKYVKDSGDNRKMVVASTASPYKFASDVYRSLTGNTPADQLDALDMLTELTGVPVPYPLRGLRERKIRFEGASDSVMMKSLVLDYIKNSK